MMSESERKRCANCKHGLAIKNDRKILCTVRSNLIKHRVMLVSSEYKCKKWER